MFSSRLAPSRRVLIVIAATLFVGAVGAVWAIAGRSESPGLGDTPAASPSLVAGDGSGIDLPERTPDPLFPEFPLPTDAVRVNTYTEGDGELDATRIASWDSGDLEEALSFYAELNDPRWSVTETLSVGYTTVFVFADAEQVFGHAELRVDPLSEGVTRLALTLNAEAAPDADPGVGEPFTPIGPEPQTQLVDDFPAALIPNDHTVLETVEASSYWLAVFSTTASTDGLVEQYESALSDLGFAVTTSSEGEGVFLVSGRRDVAEAFAIIKDFGSGREVQIKVDH